jgi:hypothetical protein
LRSLALDLSEGDNHADPRREFISVKQWFDDDEGGPPIVQGGFKNDFAFRLSGFEPLRVVQNSANSSGLLRGNDQVVVVHDVDIQQRVVLHVQLQRFLEAVQIVEYGGGSDSGECAGNSSRPLLGRLPERMILLNDEHSGSGSHDEEQNKAETHSKTKVEVVSPGISHASRD